MAGLHDDDDRVGLDRPGFDCAPLGGREARLVRLGLKLFRSDPVQHVVVDRSLDLARGRDALAQAAHRHRALGDLHP